MKKDRLVLNGAVLVYGETCVGTLLEKGYKVSHLEQLEEEPGLASCRLSLGGQVIATLCFYSLEKRVTLGQLADVPIDFAIPEKGWRRTLRKKRPATPGQQLFWRVRATAIIHMVAAALYVAVYMVPGLVEWMRRPSRGSSAHGMPLASFLLAVPSAVVMFLWAGDVVGEKGLWGKKLLLALLLVVNLLLSIGYLAAIDHILG